MEAEFEEIELDRLTEGLQQALQKNNARRLNRSGSCYSFRERKRHSNRGSPVSPGSPTTPRPSKLEGMRKAENDYSVELERSFSADMLGERETKRRLWGKKESTEDGGEGEEVDDSYELFFSENNEAFLGFTRDSTAFQPFEALIEHVIRQREQNAEGFNWEPGRSQEREKETEGEEREAKVVPINLAGITRTHRKTEVIQRVNTTRMRIQRRQRLLREMLEGSSWKDIMDNATIHDFMNSRSSDNPPFDFSRLNIK